MLTPRLSRLLLQYAAQDRRWLIRENEGAPRAGHPCSARMAASGWNESSPPPACVRWDWTGPPTSRMPNAGSVTRWRCRGNMDPLHALRRLGVFIREGRHAILAGFGSGQRPRSSAWVTASIRMWTDARRCVCEMRCTSCRLGTTAAERGRQHNENRGLRALFCSGTSRGLHPGHRSGYTAPPH